MRAFGHAGWRPASHLVPRLRIALRGVPFRDPVTLVPRPARLTNCQGRCAMRCSWGTHSRQGVTGAALGNDLPNEDMVEADVIADR